MCHANYPTVVLGEVVRDRGLLALEEAVEMMTDRPARHYGLRDRGRIAEGWHADLVVFDPADGRQPAGRTWSMTCPGAASGSDAGSRGIDHVFVAGRRGGPRRRGHRRTARDGCCGRVGTPRR